ncbi:MAG TPA: hypothetical protein VFU82_08650 [Gammaproteobacteria bacterium]|nr:hypothetical protein [Gammaproteobacteria bacterium]
MNNELIDQWEALVDAFALDEAHLMKVDELLEQCVEFYHYHNTSKASAFLYHLLTQAVNYGVSLHQPMKGLGDQSFIVKMLMNRSFEPMTLRHFYCAMNQTSRHLTFKYPKSSEVRKVPFAVNAKTGAVEGVVSVPDLVDIPAEFEGYRIVRLGPGFEGKVFNPAIAAKFFPISILDKWYFPKNKLDDRWVMYFGSNRASSMKTKKKIFVALQQALWDDYGHITGADKSEGIYIKISSIPMAGRFGVPEKTKNNYDVVMFIKQDSSIVLKIDEPLSYVDPTHKHFTTPDDYQKVKSFVEEKKFLSAFDVAIQDESNYFSLKNFFYQLKLFISLEKEPLNLLEYYLRDGGHGDGGDPRFFYQFSRRYERKAFFPKVLCAPTWSNCFYASGDGHHGFHHAADLGETINIDRNYDTAILFHLRKIGFSFKTKVVEDEVKRLLETGNYADPAFFRLMRCLCECGAPLPNMVGDQSYSDYVQERLLRLNDGERRDAAKEHFNKVLALFNVKPETAAKDIRDYFASFRLSMPSACVTAEGMSHYLQSQEGLNDFLVAMDLALLKMNEAIFNTRGSLEDFSDSVEGDKGDAKCMTRALNHYLRSGDYARELSMERAYYQLYRGLIIEICEALDTALQKAMKGGGDQPEEEEVKKSRFAAVRQGLTAATKGLKAAKRNLGVGWFIEHVDNLLKKIASLSPGDADGRRGYLEIYLELCDYIQQKLDVGENTPKYRLRSQSIRTVLSRFLSGELLKSNIVLDDEMQQALRELMSSFAKIPSATSDGVTTPGDGSDEEAELVMAATVPASAPLEGESDNEDYVPPEVPLEEETPGAQSDVKPEMPTVAKSARLFPEKKRPSVEFLSTINAYKNKIDELFYGDKSRDTLIAVIHHLNAKLGEGVALDAVGHLICPITKRIPFYPCGFKEGEFAYVDAMAFTSYYGKVIEGIVVNEASFDRLTPRELMLFFTHLQAVDRLLNLPVEAQPAPKLG